jgi:hypothetical protein
MQGRMRTFVLLLMVLPFLTGFTPLNDRQLDSVAAGYSFSTLLQLFNVINCETCILGGGCPDCTPMINNNDFLRNNFFK